MKYSCLGPTHKDSDLPHLGHNLGDSFNSFQFFFFFPLWLGKNWKIYQKIFIKVKLV